jgi:hypothetical protein
VSEDATWTEEILHVEMCLAPPGTFCKPGDPVQCVDGMCPPAAFLDFPKCK